MKKDDVSKINHPKIGEENECSYLCNPLLKKRQMFFKLFSISSKNEFQKVQEKFCINTNGSYLCIPNEKREAVKPEDL